MEIKGTNIILNGYSFFIPSNDNDIKYPFLEIVLFYDNDKVYPKLCITNTTSLEDYDYNYEDELEYVGIVTDTNYYPIEKNPFSSDEIKFVIKETIDITEKYNEINNKILELEKKRKSMSRTKEIYGLNKQLNILLQNIPIIFCNDDRLSVNPYNEHEFISIFDIIIREEE